MQLVFNILTNGLISPSIKKISVQRKAGVKLENVGKFGVADTKKFSK
jgi:hypothetical protein